MIRYGTNFTIGGQYESQIYEHLKFTIQACKNETYTQNSPNLWRPTCGSKEQFDNFTKQNAVRVQFQISNVIINPTKPKNLEQRYIANDLVFQIQPGNMYRTADIFFTENFIEQDKSWLPIEDFQSESMFGQIYGEYRDQFTYGNSSTYAAFFFNRSRFSQFYSISFQKVDDLISQIGGFVQAIMVVAAALVGFYNQEYYTIELANKIYDFDIIGQNNQNNSKDQGDQKINSDSRIFNSDRNTQQGQMDQSIVPQRSRFYKLTKMITRKSNNEKKLNKTELQARVEDLKIGENQSEQLKSDDIQKQQLKLDDMSSLNDKDSNQPKGNNINVKELNNNINNQTNTINININNTTNGNHNIDIKMNNNLTINNPINNKNTMSVNKSSPILKRNSSSIPNKNIINIKNSINNNIPSIIRNNGTTAHTMNTNYLISNSTNSEKQSNTALKKETKQIEDLNRLLSWNFQQSPPPSQRSRKKNKRVESATCSNTLNDAGKYTTISPLSLTEIDKRKDLEVVKHNENNQEFEKRNKNQTAYAENKLTTSDDLVKLIQQTPRISTMSPQAITSNPILFNLTDRKQDEKRSLIFFDSGSIDPESSIDETDRQNQVQQLQSSPVLRREKNETIFRTMQPQSVKVDQNLFFRYKSQTQINEVNQKEIFSFQSLRGGTKTQEDEPNQIQNDLSKQNFLNIYREQMRKDYMSKQLERVLKKRSKLQISLKYFIFRLSCGKFFCTKEHLLIQRANDFLQKDIDIIVILNKIKELEKLKCLLMDPNQLTLFNYFPKPLLTADKNSKSVFKVEEKIKENKKFEQQCKSLSINPLLFQTVKKAKDKFKNMLSTKRMSQGAQQHDSFSNNDLVNNMQGSQNDYQKLYKAYEQLINQQEKSRMDDILVKTLGEETKKIFQESLQMKFGMDKLQNLMTRSASKSQPQKQK